MKKITLIVCATALLSIGLLAGCSANVEKEVEITSQAKEVEALAEAAKADGWSKVASEFTSHDSEAQSKAAAINKSNVKDEVLAHVETIVSNIPAIETAAKSNNITSETKDAAQKIYLSAMTLKQLGKYDGEDVSLYIMDIADDALYMVQDMYNGLTANVDARQSECDANRSRILSFTDEEWQAFGNTL